MIRLAIGGTAFSFFAIPETTNPNPRKTISAITHSINILIKVMIPFTRVNPKKNVPISIIITELKIEKISLLNDSPRII